MSRPLARLLEVALEGRAVLLMDELEQRRLQHPPGLVTEHRAHRVGLPAHAQVVADHRDDVRRVLHERPQPALVALQPDESRAQGVHHPGDDQHPDHPLEILLEVDAPPRRMRAEQRPHPERVAREHERQRAVHGAEDEPEQRQEGIARDHVQQREQPDDLQRLGPQREGVASVADHPMRRQGDRDQDDADGCDERLGGGDSGHERDSGARERRQQEEQPQARKGRSGEGERA